MYYVKYNIKPSCRGHDDYTQVSILMMIVRQIRIAILHAQNFYREKAFTSIETSNHLQLQSVAD